jgi:hypothetical protein
MIRGAAGAVKSADRGARRAPRGASAGSPQAAHSGSGVDAHELGRRRLVTVVALGGLARFLALDALEDLLAMHGHIARCVDADADLVALHAQHGHGDVFADHHRLANSAREDQHVSPPRTGRSCDPSSVSSSEA